LSLPGSSPYQSKHCLACRS